MSRDRGLLPEWRWWPALPLGMLIAIAVLGFIYQPKNQQQSKPSQATQSYVEPSSPDERLAEYTLWLERMTGVLAVSTIGLWIVTWMALRHARDDALRQSRDMYQSLTTAGTQAQAALEQARAANDAARSSRMLAIEARRARQRASMEAMDALRAARQANEIARETGRTQTRAYLVVGDGHMYTHITPGFPSDIFIRIMNSGQTPARWTEIECNAQVIESGVAATDILINPRGKKGRWAVDPAHGQDFPCYPDCGDGDLIGLFKLAMPEKKHIVIQGAVRWETVFGEIFETTFFFWGRVVPTLPKKNADGSFSDEPIRLQRPSVDTPTYRQIRGAEEAPHSA